MTKDELKNIAQLLLDWADGKVKNASMLEMCLMMSERELIALMAACIYATIPDPPSDRWIDERVRYRIAIDQAKTLLEELDSSEVEM